MGRLVKTHSTYLEGLIKLLKRLSRDEKIKTITPGVISKVRANSNNFELRITREIRSGYKLVARKGRASQEVYIITNYDAKTLGEKIEYLIKEII